MTSRDQARNQYFSVKKPDISSFFHRLLYDLKEEFRSFLFVKCSQMIHRHYKGDVTEAQSILPGITHHTAFALFLTAAWHAPSSLTKSNGVY